MPQDVTNQLINKQMLELVVSGPDGANRLFLCTGFIKARAGTSLNDVVFHIGPPLKRRQPVPDVPARCCCALLRALFATLEEKYRKQ